MNGIRHVAGWLVAAIMVASAALHVYWGLGGRWLLARSLGIPLDRIPAQAMARLMTLVWPFAAAMLIAAFLALGRVGTWAKRVPNWILATGLWGFTAIMALGALINLLGPPGQNRMVFSVIFLVMAVLGGVLAWPPGRGTETKGGGPATAESKAAAS
jgi:hypothetical protein